MNSQTNFIELDYADAFSSRKIAVQAQKIEWIDLDKCTIFLTSGNAINVTRESAKRAYKYVLHYATYEGEE